MKVKIKPLGENVLVKAEKKEKAKTEAGIYLPEDAQKEQSQVGKVLAVGESDNIKVKKNQKIIFQKFGGNEIKIDGEEYLILKNEDILAVIE